MTKLFLIRHGNTVDEETKKVYKGRIDIPLSAKGIERMKRAAVFMSDYALDAVFTSTLSRSVQSGKIVAFQQGMDVIKDHAFDEVSFGVWEGLSFDEIRRQYPREHELWMNDPSTFPPPEGESFESGQMRSMAGIEMILEDYRDRSVAIVAHAGILRIMLFSLLDMKLSRLFRFGQDYGCINIVDVYDDGNLSLNLLNFTQY
jgi:broad specificity phosphatase PhoE